MLVLKSISGEIQQTWDLIKFLELDYQNLPQIEMFLLKQHIVGKKDGVFGRRTKKMLLLIKR